MQYQVIINGQPLGQMDRADIERRAAAWKNSGAQIEILDPVSQSRATLADFLARPPQTVPPAPAGLIDQFDSSIPQGHFEVRVNGQLIGALPAPDILRRAQIWSNSAVEISSPVTGALSLDAWRRRIATRFDPLLWPASGDSHDYSIRVRGRTAPKRATRSEIEWQSANGLLDPAAEVADDQGASTPLAIFLAGNSPVRQPPPPPSPNPAPGPTPVPPPRPFSPPAVAPFGPGPYYVRVGASTLGPLDRDDIERRAAHWPAGAVQVAESAAGPYVPLPDFLRMPRPAASSGAAQAAKSGAAQAGQPSAAQAGQSGAAFRPAPTPHPFPVAAARSRKNLVNTIAGIAALVALLILGYYLYPRLFTPKTDVLLERAQQALNSGDFSSAARLLEKAGTPDAKVQLATLYKNGLGVSQDNQKAVSLLTDAANAGSPLAQNMLGLWYANGDGVPADPTAAISWYRKAAQQGNPDAASLLALAYAGGDGVQQDPAQAYEWFIVAAHEGSSYAASQRDLLGQALDDSQRSQAESDAQQELSRMGRTQ
jgi:TPR repeat protein